MNAIIGLMHGMYGGVNQAINGEKPGWLLMCHANPTDQKG